MRIEPPPSPPVARGTPPAATRAAEPPLEPPGVRETSQGLRVMPVSGPCVMPFHPNSGVDVLQKNTAPASRSRATPGVSSALGAVAVACEPKRIGQPATCALSLIATGTPSSGPSRVQLRQRGFQHIDRRQLAVGEAPRHLAGGKPVQRVRHAARSVNVVKPSNMASTMPRQEVDCSPSTRMADLQHVRAPSDLSSLPGTFDHWGVSPRPFASRDLGRQRVELRFPETPELADPCIHRLKPRSIHRIKSSLRVRPDLCKAAFAQHLEMLRHGGLRDPELGSDRLYHFTRRHFPGTEQLEDATPHRIGKDFEDVHQLPVPGCAISGG